MYGMILLQLFLVLTSNDVIKIIYQQLRCTCTLSFYNNDSFLVATLHIYNPLCPSSICLSILLSVRPSSCPSLRPSLYLSFHLSKNKKTKGKEVVYHCQLFLYRHRYHPHRRRYLHQHHRRHHHSQNQSRHRCRSPHCCPHPHSTC